MDGDGRSNRAKLQELAELPDKLCISHPLHDKCANVLYGPVLKHGNGKSIIFRTILLYIHLHFPISFVDFPISAVNSPCSFDAMARWYSVEFLLWYLIILKVYCRKLPDAAAELAEMCNQDRRCSSYLHHSYFWPKYPIDLSDIQWREYRKVLPLLSLAAAAHILARAALGRRRTWPCLMLSGGFVLYVHGAHTIFVIAACFGSYALAKVCGFGTREQIPTAQQDQN
eukprot:s3831_g9.t1